MLALFLIFKVMPQSHWSMMRWCRASSL